MYPRKKLDIEFLDLLYGAASCLRPMGRETEARRLESLWSEEGGDDVVVTLSVRSAFDLLLEALALPEGSEVLVSAVTIRDMARIIRCHGLVPVPVDMDMKTLAVRQEALERAVSPMTRAVLVAHLFGSRMSLDPVATFARRHGLLLLEDCAQAFMADGYRGHGGSDVAFFSFGPIKSRTALGGALTRVRDGALLELMREIHSCWPVQSRSSFLVRTVKYMGVSLMLTRAGMAALRRVAAVSGTTHDAVLSSAVRGFPGPDFFRRIRRQPSSPLLMLLHRRLRTLPPEAYEYRARQGRRAAYLLRGLPRPGVEARVHSHWVFPACPKDPDGLMLQLWDAGFDATRGASSLGVIPPPESRSEADAPEAREIMERVLYLPVFRDLPDRALRRLARVVREFEGLADGGWEREAPTTEVRVGAVRPISDELDRGTPVGETRV